MTDSELLFFEEHSDVLPIYEKLKKEIPGCVPRCSDKGSKDPDLI